ncbi:MAG: HAD-IIIA family hydrolase [Planctomycetota bacterium]
MDLAQIKILVTDVDGVMTDGRIILDDRGVETKLFNVQDGAGIKYLERAGIKTAIITGRYSLVVKHRAKELKIKDVFQGCKNKIPALEQLAKKYRLKYKEICYIGDDLPDIPIMKLVGYPVAVYNARPEVKRYARYITKVPGGYGAIREVTDKILRAQKKWPRLLKRY